jgi:hypothetical protein
MTRKSTDRRWLPLNALRAFEGVAKHGSFTAAARVQMPPSFAALLTHPEGLGDPAIALFRSWLIERFGFSPRAAQAPVHLAVSNE